MSHFFHKPENALKRARELLAIPNVDPGVLKRTKHSALEILHDALIAKKNRTWQPTHEELMILYLDICLELQMGRVAKDGLHQYRNLCIQHNPASLETIIKHFVTQAERKLAAAKKESNELNLLAAAKVDLDAAQTPEDVMLSTTTFEGSNDRTDREVVVPWLRFMWETYRTVLDILKSNSKLEPLYKTTALQAFDFCVEYQRKIEFRRVCEIMRNHLSALQKHAAAPTSQSTRQMRSWDGFTLESVERLLEVRYRQLQVATDLELFSEAFRTIDDINNIMNLVEQTPRVDLLVTYYEKLAQIFLVSKNQLFHAYALYKWYSLRVAGLQGLAGALALQELPVLVSEEEQKEMATRVVLAALSIPLLDFEASSAVLGDDSVAQTTESSLSSAARDKNSRMAALLGFATTPTRANLLEDIAAAGILPKASTAASEIFQRVELQEVDPLQIVKQLQPFLTTIRAEPLAKAYVDGVERLVVRRVLFQLTRVYASVTIAHLRSIFVGLDVSYEEIETLIARSRSLSTVAHASAPSLSSMYRRNATQHGSNNAETSSADAVSSAQTRTRIRIDHVEQCIRFTDAIDLEANATQLTLLGERLSRAMSSVPAAASASIAAREEQKKKLFAATRSRMQEQRSEMLARREIIERKKEELEKLQQEKIQSLEKKRQEFAQRRAELERERLAQEARRREAEKKQKIQDEIKLKETRQMLDKLGHTDVSDLDLATIDKEKVLNEAKEKARKAKELAQQKLRENARRLDYIVRATREEEQPILQRQVAEAKAEALKRYEQESSAKLKRAKEEHEHGLKEKSRLAPAIQVSTEFIKAHKARRIEEYKKASEEQKKKAMLERLSTRVAHAKQRYEEEQERLREEEEEKERIRREEEAERERQRQLEVEEELRRQEEEEAEEARIAEEKEREERAQRQTSSIPSLLFRELFSSRYIPSHSLQRTTIKMRYTELLALAMGNLAAAQFTTGRFSNTTTGAIETGTATTGTDVTGTETSGAATSTSAGGIGNPDGFNFLGCFSSENGFPGFTQAYSSEENDSERCADACLGSNFFGLYDNSCYCGNTLDISTSPAVGTDQCDITCPGNSAEDCGGLSAGDRLMRRQVAVNVLLSVYVAVGVNPGETDTVINTDFVTETLPPVTTTATVTFTEDGTTVTQTVTTVLPAIPTDVIIICYGNYCAPQVHCPTCTKWQIVCEDGLCAPRECHDDTWTKLKICNSGKCHYADYKGDECNQRIVCYGNECQRDQHYSVDYARKFVCDVDEDRWYFDECKDDCYTYEKCSKGECEPVHPPVKPEPVHPPKPVYPGKPPVVVVPEPETPSKPTKPETPYTPEHPETPAKPEHPETPAKPETPETPAKPETPETPAKPETPETTGTGSKPEVPVVTAGAAQKTFAGVAAAIAGLAFVL